MPFLVRGKARARQYNTTPKSGPATVVKPKPTVVTPITVVASPSLPTPEASLPQQPINENCSSVEEQKISYQEITYRVPKEERLLDLPLEEEVPGEDYVVPEEASYNIMPVADEIPIGVALKKKRRK